jgi:hypothetical protein
VLAVDDRNQLWSLDVSQAQAVRDGFGAPQSLGTVDHVSAVTVVDDTIFVADRMGGLYIMQADGGNALFTRLR